MAYYIKDGDIPCTPEIEPSFSYVWNFCAQVPAASYPKVCDAAKQQGAALQYIDRTDGYHECNVIGHYDSARDDLYYDLIDHSNPSKGVTMKYPDGDKCPNNKLRTATLDVICDNEEMVIESALEPTECDYHIVMRSYRGCPTVSQNQLTFLFYFALNSNAIFYFIIVQSCPVNSQGLCSSHGHCAFDPKLKKSYCYCNAGRTGDDCSKKVESTSYDGYSVQLGLLIVLLIVTVALIGVTGSMIYRVTRYRKEQVNDYYSLAGSHEMSTHHGEITF